MMRSAICSLALTVSLLSVGCGTVAPPGRQFTAHGQIALPTDAGKIGLSHARSGEFKLLTPLNREQASRVFGAEIVRNPDPRGAIAVPAFYLVGRAVGTALGVPESTIASGRLAAGSVLAEYPTRELLERALRTALGDRDHAAAHELEDDLPVEPRAIHGRMTPAGRSQLTWVNGRPEAHPLQGTDIDTLIGARVSFIGLQARPDLKPANAARGGYSEYNPPLVLSLALEFSGIAVADWTRYGDLDVRCDSGPRRFEEWTANDAQVLRAELAAAWEYIARELARRIVRVP